MVETQRNPIERRAPGRQEDTALSTQKPTFETLRAEDDPAALYDLLRYENAALKAQCATQDSELARLRTRLARLEAKLDAQQEVIEVLNAECVHLRAP